MIQSVKLYHYPLSRSVRVKWLLHEIMGEDFAVERVALMQGGQFAPGFTAKNPNHAVPVLDVSFEDGSERTVFESTAMLIWLADIYADKALAPAISDLHARADYLQMMQFGGSWMDMMLWQIRLHSDLLPKTIADDNTVTFNRDKFTHEVEPQLAARLEAHDFICGPAFSAADCMIGYNVGWARGYGLCTGDVFSAYRSRLAKRPAFALAYADAKDFGQ